MAFKLKRSSGSSPRGPRPAQFGKVKIRTGASFGQNIGKVRIRFQRKSG